MLTTRTSSRFSLTAVNVLVLALLSLVPVYGQANPLADAKKPQAVNIKKIAPSSTASKTVPTKKPAAARQPAVPNEISMVSGGAQLLKFPFSVSRVAVGDPNTLDYVVVSEKELYVLGKSIGTTTLIVWDQAQRSHIISSKVGMDIAPLRASLRQMLPKEKTLTVSTAADSVILNGVVSDTVAMEAAIRIASAYLKGQSETGGAASVQKVSLPERAASEPKSAGKLINLLEVADPQQVVLEVRIAEVSKNLLERLGLSFSTFAAGQLTNLSFSKGVLSVDPASSDPALGAIRYLLSGSRGQVLQLDALKEDDLVKILAEPTIVAMSGKEGSFTAGGQIYIPIPTVSGSSPTLQEKDFGIQLKFLPRVLEQGRIELQVAPEVSEILSFKQPDPPVFSVRKVSTTVQLKDGETLVIGGLMKNNVKENIKALPILGEIPILGALFRSSEFINERSELVVVVSPRLVRQALATAPALPTDSFIPPSRSEFFLEGKLQGGQQSAR
jgi:pilus assembly protein CpaC